MTTQVDFSSLPVSRVSEGPKVNIDNEVNWEFDEVDACLACGSKQSKTIYEKSPRSIPLRFVQCQQCQLVYQTPRMTRSALAQYFNSSTFIQDSKAEDASLEDLLGYPDYFDWDYCYTKTASLRLDAINKLLPQRGNMLEIGTATGSFLNEARKHGYKVRGLDVSKTFAEMATRNYNLNIDVAFVEEFPLPTAAYDVICTFGGIACWRDPVAGLKNIRQALKPGGILVMNHPNIDGTMARLQGRRWFEFNHASLTIFSNRTLGECLKAAGFQVLQSRTERQYASLGRIVTYFRSDWGNRILKALGLSKVVIPVIVSGTTFSVCAPRDQVN